ncbi:Rv1733c family protein [Streptomyces griseus]|uniref:Rv1733c family protein n=1 Tax=Streptomyces griseus TaxID=1911 RepID=UPI00083FEA4E|nr:hypothetical protein [Streptomyces griseus]
MRGTMWHCGRNTHPLRRRVDVLEARLLLVLCLLVIGCASVFGVTKGWAAYDHERSVAAEQRAARHPVRALVLRDAPGSKPWADESGRTEKVVVPVRWTGPSGAHVTGKALVAPGTERGEHTTLWVDRRGDTTSAPPGSRDVWSGALTEGLSGVAVVAGAGAVAGIGLRKVCNRFRAVHWETEWSRVEPEWSRRV